MEIYDSAGRPVWNVPIDDSTIGITQIKSHDACPRYWYLESVLKIPTPIPAHFLKGTVVHKRIELFIRFGVRLDDSSVAALNFSLQHVEDLNEDERKAFVSMFVEAGAIAAAGVHLLPAPGASTVLGAEVTLYHWIPLQGAFTGYFVCWRGTIDLLERSFAALHITDHKTAATLEFVDDGTTLSNDIQTLTYSWAAVAAGLNPDALPIRMRKNYFSSNRRFTPFAVEAAASPEKIQSVPSMLSTAATAMAVDACRTESDVPRNFEHCSAYRGCKFAARCLTAEQNLDLLFRIDDARKKPKGKTPMNTGPALTQTPGFDREAFLRNIGQAPTTAQGSAANSAPAQGAPVANPAPAVQQPAPVANTTDPFTLKLINSLQESQIRALGAELIPGVTPQIATVQIVEALRTHFNNDSGAMLDAWIVYARGKFPANPAPVNPPESSIAQPVEATSAALAAKADGRKARNVAKTDNETALRTVCREIGVRTLKIMVEGDKAPSSTSNYEGFRIALKQGAKPNQNTCATACAEEWDARGLSPDAVKDWAAKGTAPHAQQSAAPVAVPQRVIDAAAARGESLPGVIASDPPGILTSEAEQIDKFLTALDDPRFGFLFWNNPPATGRFKKFADSVRLGMNTHRMQCVHELICDYAGSQPEGNGHGIKSFAAAVTHWIAICAAQGVDPAALGVPSIAPSATPQNPVIPTATAPVQPPAPIVNAPDVATVDPLAGIGNVKAFDGSAPDAPDVANGAPEQPGAVDPLAGLAATPPADEPAPSMRATLDGRNARIAALFAELAQLFGHKA